MCIGLNTTRRRIIVLDLMGVIQLYYSSLVSDMAISGAWPLPVLASVIPQHI